MSIVPPFFQTLHPFCFSFDLEYFCRKRSEEFRMFVWLGMKWINIANHCRFFGDDVNAFIIKDVSAPSIPCYISSFLYAFSLEYTFSLISIILFQSFPSYVLHNLHQRHNTGCRCVEYASWLLQHGFLQSTHE